MNEFYNSKVEQKKCYVQISVMNKSQGWSLTSSFYRLS